MIRFARCAIPLLIGALALITLSPGATAQSPAPSTAAAATVPAGDFKIGIMTGTVSQGEDEFRAAQMAAADFPGKLSHVTYPDNFMQEQETTTSQLAGLASDPKVKAIVISQAIPGSIAGIKKIKATRPDMLFFMVEPHEDPQLVNSTADLVLQPDQLERGRTIVALANKMGAKKFLHYSFPRHMSQALLAQRRDRMEAECKKLNMQFLSLSAPDPLGESGVPGAQQFIKEDVPRQVAEHGAAIAVFSTNCSMQEMLIKAALETGCMFPEQCCPSPTHGYPGALGIEIDPAKAGDMDYISGKVKEKITEAGGTGRFATWKAPASILATRACVAMAVKVLEGKAKINDQAALEATFKQLAGSVTVTLSKFDKNAGNFYTMLVDSQIF